MNLTPIIVAAAVVAAITLAGWLALTLLVVAFEPQGGLEYLDDEN
jgi:hypothetical protein